MCRGTEMLQFRGWTKRGVFIKVKRSHESQVHSPSHIDACYTYCPWVHICTHSPLTHICRLFCILYCAYTSFILPGIQHKKPLTQICRLFCTLYTLYIYSCAGGQKCYSRPGWTKQGVAIKVKRKIEMNLHFTFE